MNSKKVGIKNNDAMVKNKFGSVVAQHFWLRKKIMFMVWFG